MSLVVRARCRTGRGTGQGTQGGVQGRYQGPGIPPGSPGIARIARIRKTAIIVRIAILSLFVLLPPLGFPGGSQAVFYATSGPGEASRGVFYATFRAREASRKPGRPGSGQGCQAR